MRTDQQPVRIALFAPDGRMGRAIADAAASDDGAEIAGDVGDVLVDFSAPDALHHSLDRALSAGVPILIGTTGLTADHDKMIEEAARSIAVLVAPNTSLGVALLADLVERAAAVLGPDEWDIEIVEAHHRRKADAPSGTALHLGAAAERGRGVPMPIERGRDGTGLARQAGALGYSAVRGGTVAGDHDVLFLGPDERVILSHRAENRSIFARGAVAAAKFLRGLAPGRYTMRDVLDAK
ncbi:4-hydroxy-tetrahydrodipicolinate reductase [Sphingomonas sp. LY160]|uniref:4-hydroxy-tetrahydrodipicolinate reductase n=1 Tax=Sphingomonas sp. LY160 TaxID=3095342 RepID=UPI002ADEEDE5|nr:4-hydroxy-tetrahydrodipicolinate reductase [Sphingomonas sp. LY160]MEA1071570.1 4-hydroxy-tetrahydrodipicolinate reductase [Sphingomonas sp. LY160]